MAPIIGESGYMRHERDFYQTPAWVTLALLKHWRPWEGGVVWECAAGAGKMAEALMDMGIPVIASDIEPEPHPHIEIGRCDFLKALYPPLAGVETATFKPFVPYGTGIITNPPFEQSQAFVARCLELIEPCNGSVALLLPTDWDHAPGRGKAKARARLTEHPKHAMQIKLRRRIRWIEGTTIHPRKWHSWHVWDMRHEGPQQVYYAG